MIKTLNGGVLYLEFYNDKVFVNRQLISIEELFNMLNSAYYLIHKPYNLIIYDEISMRWYNSYSMNKVIDGDLRITITVYSISVNYELRCIRYVIQQNGIYTRKLVTKTLA